MRKILIFVILGLALCSISIPVAAYAQQTTSSTQPAAGAFVLARFGPTGISGDQQYLYVMAGGKILEYEIAEMTLLRSVDLPDSNTSRCGLHICHGDGLRQVSAAASSHAAGALGRQRFSLCVSGTGRLHLQRPRPDSSEYRATP